MHFSNCGSRIVHQVRWSINLHKVRCQGQRTLLSVRLGQVRLGLIKFGQVRFGQVRLSQVRFGQVRLGQVKFQFPTVKSALLSLTILYYNPIMVKGYKRDFTKFFGLTVETIQNIFYIVMGWFRRHCTQLVYKHGPTYDIRNAIGNWCRSMDQNSQCTSLDPHLILGMQQVASL